VQRSLKQLGDELDELVALASPITHVIEEEPSNADFDALRQQVALLTAEVGSLPPPAKVAAIPPQLFFAQFQPVNTISPPQVLTLFNVGNSSLRIGGITLPPGTEFNIVEPQPGDFPITLAAQTTLAVSVAFAPTVSGTATATLTVAYNNTTLPIPLQGTGV
jgi:hypothetical protein